ncbi:MAG TPA: KOW motif-containing protein [Pyrinomonadaceae bacterium]|nr:KOW motif-containing protein [Pyrinomonadaceae bacterium]
MKAEESIVELGDTVRLRSGPYAGQTGTVVRVSVYGTQGPSGTLVMVKLSNGRIDPCYMSNVEKVK